jgi:gluconate kinase
MPKYSPETVEAILETIRTTGSARAGHPMSVWLLARRFDIRKKPYPDKSLLILNTEQNYKHQQNGY